MSTNAVFVGGRWDLEGGRKSSYFEKFASACIAEGGEALSGALIMNGGYWDDLARLSGELSEARFLIWAPDIPNDMPKLAKHLKESCPKAMLTITKNNADGKYGRLELVARALQSKANLLVEFTRGEGGIEATIIDPLGNSFCERESDIGRAAKAWAARMLELASFSRVASTRLDGGVPSAPSGEEFDLFMSLAKSYAEKFHEIIHAANQSRMLGNLSFRCENGFPSARGAGAMFVSRRNIDKRDMGPAGFCACPLDGKREVGYFGEAKPSVDSPIQKALYQAWPEARYMLHSHCFIEGAVSTKTIIPCGAMEEAEEILAMFPSYDPAAPLFINLRGHGSLAVASNPSQLAGIAYVAKPAGASA